MNIIIPPIINMIIIIIFNSLKPWRGSSSKSYEMPGRDNTQWGSDGASRQGCEGERGWKGRDGVMAGGREKGRKVIEV